MKKNVLVLLLFVIVSLGAFANHPSGWGVGIVGQGGFAWDGLVGGGGPALSIKAPQLPIYWDVSLDFGKHGFGLSVTGDRYFIDKTLASDIDPGWYLGLGAYAGFHSYSYESTNWTYVRGGLRLPAGIYILPIPFWEIFIDVAPSLGVGLYFGDYDDSFHFPEDGLGMDTGLHFWFL